MNKLIEIDRYFVLRENSIVEPYPNLYLAIENSQGHEIIVDKFKGHVQADKTNAWRLAEFEFYNNESENILPKPNGWTIYKLEITHKTGQYIIMLFSILDPKSQVRQFRREVKKKSDYDDLNDNDIIAVIETKKIFLEYASFSNWKEVEILEENKKLKEEILKLKEKLKLTHMTIKKNLNVI